MYFTFSAILTLLIVGKWIVESKPLKTITMQKVKAFVKKYPHSILITLALLFTGVLAVMGQQWADNAKTNGGAIVWYVSEALAALAFFYIVKWVGKNGAGDPE